MTKIQDKGQIFLESRVRALSKELASVKAENKKLKSQNAKMIRWIKDMPEIL